MFLTMYLDTTDKAVEGPGWYMSGFEAGLDATQILPTIRLSTAEALRVANLVDELSQGKVLHAKVGVKQSSVNVSQNVVQSGEQIKSALYTQLDEAEEAARRIASLRRGILEFDNSTSETK